MRNFQMSKCPHSIKMIQMDVNKHETHCCITGYINIDEQCSWNVILMRWKQALVVLSVKTWSTCRTSKVKAYLRVSGFSIPIGIIRKLFPWADKSQAGNDHEVFA